MRSQNWRTGVQITMPGWEAFELEAQEPGSGPLQLWREPEVAVTTKLISTTS